MEFRRRRAVRLGVPAVIVAVLAVIALWRVAPPPSSGERVGTTGTVAPYPDNGPLTLVADALLANSIGRQASLEHVIVREVTGPDTFWAGAIDEQPVFVAVAPDATRARGVTVEEGNEVTLVGVVRPAPEAQDAIARWHVTAATAKAIRDIGTYLEASEIK